MSFQCPICTDIYEPHEMVLMPGCPHSVCKECFKGHFTNVMKMQSVKHFNCPVCAQPDMSKRDADQDMYLELLLDMVKQLCTPEVADICSQKLRGHHLSTDPNFCWCVNDKCNAGFINDTGRDMIACPACRKKMCFKCKKPWEKGHEGLTCDEFAQWKHDNDPQIQQQGLAVHLEANDEECPICTDHYMTHEMVLMPGCPHSVCKECFKGHFTNVMKTQTVKHFNCPVCAQPDMTDPQIETYLMLLMPLVSETFAICVSDMFHGATQLFDKIKMHIDKEVYNLGQQKLIEYNLSRESNFCLCANDKCHAGFTNETGREKIACPICKKEMCFICKKPWERAHEGLTCDEFAQWKHDNDPQLQQQGLAAHLEANDEECPICIVHYMTHEMVLMPGCPHSVCIECFKGHFTNVMKTQTVKHFNCPVCAQPDMTDPQIETYLMLLMPLVSETFAICVSDMFHGATQLFDKIKMHIDKEVYNLGQQKLIEYNLSREPNFCWCANWERAHEGLTCDEFAQWKHDNDPQLQQQGLAAHLEANDEECPICTDHYMTHEMVLMPGCPHSVCIECFKGHFTNVMKTQTVKHFNCPVCAQPDMTDPQIETYLMLLMPLDKCHAGFTNETGREKIACPICKKEMCFICKKPWERAHEGLTCDEFAQWKHDNDPQLQQQGLAAHLEANDEECPICIVHYMTHEMVLMPGCPHSVCIECFKGHFTNVMKTQTVKHFNCPVCAQPDMTDPQIETYLMLLMPLVSETFAICVSDMFHGATQLFDKIKMHIDKEVYNLGQQKLIEYNLSREPNFCWCANDKCHAGFTNETGREKIACPICKKEMCFICKKPWERAHEGLTCDEFAQWKHDNDPQLQQQGLAAHLEANDEECPICTDHYMTHEMVLMPGCPHSVCIECFKGHFTNVMKTQTVKHFNCPDMFHGATQLFDKIKMHIDKEVYNLGQQKLIEYILSREPNFCWCANDKCHAGFTNETGREKIACPICKKEMCFKCKKPQQGLAAHLEANGIECPACHFCYDLARGGCMHFKCTQCPKDDTEDEYTKKLIKTCTAVYSTASSPSSSSIGTSSSMPRPHPPSIASSPSSSIASSPSSSICLVPSSSIVLVPILIHCLVPILIHCFVSIASSPSSSLPRPHPHIASSPSSSIASSPSSSIPVTPSSSIPVTPSSSIPVTPSSSIPVAPSSSIPVTPSSSIPVTPSSSIPVTPILIYSL
eukprot:Em0290g1a